MTSTLESLLDDCRIGDGGRIQIDQFGENGGWRAVVSHFSGRTVIREDVTPSAALRVALIEDDRLQRDRQRHPPADDRQMDLEDAIAAVDYGDLLG